MRFQHPLLVMIGVMLVSGAAQIVSAAAGRPLAVDLLSLKSGRTLRGALLGRQADGSVLMAVSRGWLKKSDPKEFARRSAADREQQRSAWKQTKVRIEQQVAEPDISQRMASYFKQQLQRIERQLALESPPESLFFLMEISGKHVSKAAPASPDRQRIALWAWKESLSDVETRTVVDLRKELMAAGIDLDGPPPDLSDLLPVREQSEAEWSTRLAITTYTLDGGLDFQGKGNLLVRAGGAQIPLVFVLPKLLTGEAEALFGELFNPGGPSKPGGPPLKTKPEDALKAAIAEVEQRGQTGFRVTWLEMNVERLIVAVGTEFIAKQPDGTWQPVWQHLETADGSIPRPQAEAAILGNPEVKQILEPLEGLGFDDALTKSIRFGAAAMTAQKAADGQFFQFRDRYMKRLDGPVLLAPFESKEETK